VLTHWELFDRAREAEASDGDNLAAMWLFADEPPGAYVKALIQRGGRVEEWRPVPSPAFPHDQPNWRRVR
jgi:hypothetical protein